MVSSMLLRLFVSSRLFSFFFFFKCSADHRDLHSFPTRRSSDLVEPKRAASALDRQNFTRRVDASVSNHARRVKFWRSEEHTSELQSRGHLVCRLLLEKKKTKKNTITK